MAESAYMKIKPDHPDVERVASITRSLDWLNNHGVARFDQEAAFEEAVQGCGVDLPSLSYVAFQRALMASGAQTSLDLMVKQGEVAKMSSAWLEGFVVGARYAKEQSPVQP